MTINTNDLVLTTYCILSSFRISGFLGYRLYNIESAELSCFAFGERYNEEDIYGELLEFWKTQLVFDLPGYLFECVKV